MVYLQCISYQIDTIKVFLLTNIVETEYSFLVRSTQMCTNQIALIRHTRGHAHAHIDTFVCYTAHMHTIRRYQRARTYPLQPYLCKREYLPKMAHGVDAYDDDDEVEEV